MIDESALSAEVELVESSEVDLSDIELKPSWSDESKSAALACIEKCEGELQLQPDHRYSARLHFEIARLYEAPIGDLRRAAAHYQEALKHRPQHLPTIQGARRVLIGRRSYQAALELYDEELRLTPDPGRKAQLTHAKGRLLEDVLGRRDDAAEAYSSALELDRANPAVLGSLYVRTVEEQKWNDVDRVLEQVANAVADDARHRAILVAERARLVEYRKEDPERATELYEIAVRLDPQAPGALAALKRLHHQQRRWRDLIRVLLLEAELTESRTVATMALFRVARIHENRLGNRQEAVTVLERAVKESPGDPVILLELVRLYEVGSRWDGLVTTLQALAQHTKQPAERLTLLHRMGGICEARLGRDQDAAHWYSAALAIDASHVPTLQAIAPLLERLGEWEKLANVLSREAEAASDSKRRAASHSRVAEILERHLLRKDEAVEHFAKALGVLPNYAPAFKALSRLLSEAGRYRDLVELYERGIEVSSDEEQTIALLMKVGSIYEDLLREPERASAAYRRVLAIDETRRPAIHALQRSAELATDWRTLVYALDAEAKLVRKDGDRVALLHRSAEVLDSELDDRNAALTRLHEVLEIDASYAPALTSLGSLYHSMGRWEDLLDVYQRELDVAKPGPDSAALLYRMGELSLERIGREEKALEHFRRALEQDPTHNPSLRALTQRLRNREDWPGLLETLQMELSGQGDPRARARTQTLIGEVYEDRLREPEKAIRAYEQALLQAPGYRPALDAIARMRANAKHWQALAQDLEQEAVQTSDGTMATDALLRRAEVLARELNEPRKAIVTLEAIIERYPTHLGALWMLEGLYRRVGQWDALAIVHATQAQCYLDGRARVASLEAQARILESRVKGEPELVARVYQHALEIAPTYRPAMEGLERIALSEGNPGRLAAVDELLMQAAEDRSLRAAYALRRAEALEALDGDGALDAYREALRLDPESISGTRGLGRIADRIDDPAVLAEAARREAEIARDPAEKARLLVRSADVRTERLGDVDTAVGELSQALDLDPNSQAAAERLSRVLRAKGEDRRLVDSLSRAANIAEPERATSLWMEIATLHADQLGHLTGAIGALQRVLRNTPNHVPTLSLLAEYFERDRQWSEAVKQLTLIVQLASDEPTLVDAHMRLAKLFGQKLGDGARARVSLQAVLQLDPNHDGALHQLAELFEREGRADEAAQVAQRLVSLAKNPADRANALLRAARLERSLGNDSAAAHALREAVAIEGPGSDSAIECKALCQTDAAWGQYVDALRSHLRTLPEDKTATTYIEIGTVLFERLRRQQEAIQVLKDAAQVTKDPRVRRELALRLRLGGKWNEGVAVLQALAKDDVLRAETWRELVKTFSDAQLGREARLAAEPLLVLGKATERETRLRQTSAPRPLHANPGTVGPLLERFASPTKQQVAAGDLLRSIGSGMVKLYPPDLEGYGLTSRDRLLPKHADPLFDLVHQIAEVVGAPEFELYVHRVRSRGMGLELGTVPMLIVPAAVSELPRAQQVYLLARPLVLIARGLPAVGKLTPRELDVLLASAARQVRPGYGKGLTSEDVLEEQSKRLHRALSRRARKGMEEAAEEYVSAGRIDFPRWTHGLHRTSHRVAALLCDDLPAACAVLRRTERELQGLEGAALVEGSPVVKDLLAFWVSKPAMQVRQHAGLLD